MSIFIDISLLKTMIPIERTNPCRVCKKLPYRRYGEICGTCYNRSLKLRSEEYRNSLNEYNRKRLLRKKMERSVTVECGICKNNFPTGYKHQKCCKGCVKEKIRIYHRTLYEKECGKSLEILNQLINCKVCRKEFKPKRFKQKHCTSQCFVKGYQKVRNKEKKRFYESVREFRLRGSAGSFTFKEWEDLKKKYDGQCPSCGEKEKLTIDHIKPISRGGDNSIDNIQPLCLRCNILKGNRHNTKYEIRNLERATA